jgi:hypothetical protein
MDISCFSSNSSSLRENFIHAEPYEDEEFFFAVEDGTL